MTRPLLVSDANILIDMEAGGLTEKMFQLDYDFAVPDTLFVEELTAQHEHLTATGIEARELAPAGVTYLMQLAQNPEYRKVGFNDLSALALAKQESCPVLTGDQRLARICESEGVEQHGTLWVIQRMLEVGVIDVSEAETAYAQMKNADRRLPWKEVNRQMRSFER